MAKPAATARGGFSLLETLIALAIVALATAIVLPRLSSGMDQITDHAVFFDFQRQVSDLRRQAFVDQAPLAIVAPASMQGSQRRDEVVIALRPGWSYALSQPLRVDEGGRCGKVDVDLLLEGKRRLHLVSGDESCHLLRVS